MRKHTYLGAGIAAGALLAAFCVAPASADTADDLTAGGANVGVGDSVTAGLASSTATFSTSIGNIVCTASNFAATVATNPAVGTGEATETVTALAFSSCTSTISGTSGVSSIGLTSGTTPTATVDDSNPAAIALDVSPSVTVVLRTVLGNIRCVYAGAVSGAIDNTADTITFSGQPVARQTGSSFACPSTGSFTASYGPTVDNNILDANGNPTAVTAG
jgi:hypothetical protein